MRSRSFFCLLALTIGTAYASASHHDVTLTVVTSVTEDVPAPLGVAVSQPTSITGPSSLPCPGGLNPVGISDGTLTQCQWSTIGTSGTTKVKSTTVRAFLTTATGERFDISMFCSRYHGSCPESKAGTAYAAELNDAPKYLADYAKRRAYGTMKVKFSPDGKKKVSYDIIFATRAGSTQTHPD